MPPPVNTIAPAITGTAEIGNRLECSTGKWTGGVQSYAFQWVRVNANDGPIAGATSQYYIVSADDCRNALKCIVTATNIHGSTSVESNTTDIVPDDWLEVEDGTGKPNAVSYASRAEASDYHAKRNNPEWLNLTCGQRNAALVNATAYMEAMYGYRWKGSKATEAQALSWPRSGVTVDGFEIAPDTLPKRIKDVCCELALKASRGELAQDIQPGGTVTQETVFGAVSVSYSDKGVNFVQYRIVDNMLSQYLKSGGMFQFEVRRG
jgi:hypothetical protein